MQKAIKELKEQFEQAVFDKDYVKAAKVEAQLKEHRVHQNEIVRWWNEATLRRQRPPDGEYIDKFGWITLSLKGYNK